MNILHISTPSSWRGGEQQLAYLALELNDKLEEQLFLCTQGGAMEAFCFENELVAFPGSQGLLSLPTNAALLKRICRNYAIDIIHTHDSKAHTLAFYASITGNKTPIVVSRKVDFPVGKSWLSRKKYNHPLLKRIICVSEKIKEVTGASIENKSVLRVIYDGIETNIDLSTPKPDLHEIFDIPQEYAIVGNVAALAPHKDYFTWLDTAKLLKEQGQKIKFIAFGEGPTKEKIEAYITSLGLDEDVILAGFREDAKDLMRGFDVFFTSSETEGLGTSTLDAYVRQVPVVATAAGGIPEIVKDGQTGLLAPVKDPAALANAITRLLHDDQLRGQLINNATEWVKQFDKSMMAAKTLAEYEAVVKEVGRT